MDALTIPREFEHLTLDELQSLVEDKNVPEALRFDLHGEIAHRQYTAIERARR